LLCQAWQHSPEDDDDHLPAGDKKRNSFFKRCESFRRVGHEEEAQLLAVKAREGKAPSRCVLDPSDRSRLVWDLCGMALIFYDMFAIPFQLAFDPEPSLGLDVMGWIILIFWTADILMSFNTGYFHKGNVVMSRLSIGVRYIRGWLILDLVVVIPDWLGIIAGSSDLQGLALLRMGKLVRVLRILRTMRLLRLAKLKKALEAVQDMVRSDSLMIVGTVIQYILIIILINHIIACAWYTVGSAVVEGQDSWVYQRHFRAGRDTLLYKYATSLHWSLTQFTPASMEVLPENVRERVFSVCVLVFALIVFSSFLSSITSAMTQLRSLHGAADKTMSHLRRFLRHRNIKSELFSRIMRYVEIQMAEHQSTLQEHDVVALKLLSRPLQMELRQATYAPLLKVHPFFRLYELADPEAMRILCINAISLLSLSSGDVVFTEGAKCEEMMFVLKGKLRYFFEPAEDDEDGSGDDEELNRSAERVSQGPPHDEAVPAGLFAAANDLQGVWTNAIEAGQWCCEAALWTDWVHAGTALAVANSEIMLLKAAAFAKVTKEHRRVLNPTWHYGEAFVKELNAYKKNLQRDVPIFNIEVVEERARNAFPPGLDDDQNEGILNQTGITSLNTLQRAAFTMLSSQVASLRLPRLGRSSPAPRSPSRATSSSVSQDAVPEGPDREEPDDDRKREADRPDVAVLRE